MAELKRVLLVDDEPDIQAIAKLSLDKVGGFTSLICSSGYEAIDKIADFKPDLLLLDVMMPGEDGMSVCRRLRQANDQTPIIMLTAKTEDMDRIRGLEIGADDYVAKPFNPRELLARVNAVLRRHKTVEHPAGPSHESEIFEFGPYTLNLSKRTLQKDNVDVPITTGEFSVLKVFARQPRVPLSRDKLMELARGREYEAFDRSLDVQISRLRKLIEPNPTKPVYIQTVWGLGYVFVPDDEG